MEVFVKFKKVFLYFSDCNVNVAKVFVKVVKFQV